MYTANTPNDYLICKVCNNKINIMDYETLKPELYANKLSVCCQMTYKEYITPILRRYTNMKVNQILGL